MTIAAIRSIDSVGALVEPELRRHLDQLDPQTRLVAGYHLGYWNRGGVSPSADGSGTGRGGKGIRAALALLAGRAAGQPPERAVPGAVAIELTHNFSLLHDDVMDGDTERRHRPTAWAVFGIPAAILTGDALLSLAGEVLAGVPAPAGPLAAQCLGAAVRRLVAGQVADLAFVQRDDVTLDECLAMAADKTGALIGAACRIGAVLAGASPALREGLTRYGAHLGLAFQLVDDLLGIWGEPARTGKPVLADLRERKRSLPVVHAGAGGTDAGERFRALYQAQRSLSGGELELAARLLEAAGSREWTEAEAGRQLSAALAALDRLGLPEDVHTELIDLANFVTGRDH